MERIIDAEDLRDAIIHTPKDKRKFTKTEILKYIDSAPTKCIIHSNKDAFTLNDPNDDRIIEKFSKVSFEEYSGTRCYDCIFNARLKKHNPMCVHCIHVDFPKTDNFIPKKDTMEDVSNE